MLICQNILLKLGESWKYFILFLSFILYNEVERLEHKVKTIKEVLQCYLPNAGGSICTIPIT